MSSSKNIYGKIKNIILEESSIIIELESTDRYYSEIVKGSVKCNIFNERNKIVPLSLLNEGDIIQLKVLENKIIKIYIKSKYDFISDSSEDEYFLE